MNPRSSLFHFSSRWRSFFSFFTILFITLTILISFSHQNEESHHQIRRDAAGHSSELPSIDPKQLMEVKVINKSVNYYKNQFIRVRASLRDQLDEFVAQLKSIGNRTSFSPELKEKLNETMWKFIEDLELSPYCLASFQHLRVEVQNKRFWPLKFIDAMEFVTTGMLEGSMSSFGLWEECVNIVSPDVKWNGIQGKYCLAKIRLSFLQPSYPTEEYLDDEDDHYHHHDDELVYYGDDHQELHHHHSPEKSGSPKVITIDELNTYEGKKALLERLNRDFDHLNNKLKLMQMANMFNGSYLRFGLCFPSTCSSAEIERAINKFLEPIQNPLRIEIEEECSYKGQPWQLDNYQLVSILIFVAFGLLVGGATIYEYYRTNIMEETDVGKNQYDQHILKFSALTNTRLLLGNDEKRLCAVDALSLAFICLEFVGRSYVMPVFFGMMNIKRALTGLPNEYFTAKKFFFIRGSSFAVCTYMLGSATVLAYNICAHKSNVKPSLVNYLKYLVARWLSLFRRILGPILLIYVLPLVGEGPIWHYFDQLYTEPCRKNLWPTLLFFSNYNDSLEETCLPTSVIFCIMFFTSLIAPLILYTLNTNVTGTVIFVALIILGSLVSLVPKIAFEIPVTPFEVIHTTSVEQSKHSFIHYSAATDQYLVVIIVGLFLGYLIRCKPKINLGKRATNIALWLGLMALPLISTSWNEGFKPLEGNFSQFSFISWFVLSKLMWSAGFGWIIFTCCTGRAKPINELMSLSLIRPLGKLAFGVYANHITVLAFRQLTKREASPLTHQEILTNDIADLVIAFTISYIFYILIERPLYYLVQMFVTTNAEDEQVSTVKRFSHDLENGKINDKEEMVHMKPLTSSRL